MQPTVQAQLLQWFLTVAVPLLAAVAFRALNLYAHQIQYERPRAIALDLVAAAEQQFPQKAAGEVKRNSVAAAAATRGIKLDRPAIEAAVYQLNASKSTSAVAAREVPQ